jgi:aryl sulfotransferase
MSGIIWLASYPKSGNTWFRVFLTNLLRDADEPADINALDSAHISSARAVFDDEVGIEAGDLIPEEIDRLRPRVYEQLAETATETLFMKVHDAWTLLPDGSPLLSPKATQGAIYFIRNPLDVAVSYAHHNGTDIDKAIDCMGDADHALCGKPGRLPNQLRQKLLSWSSNVESWLNAPGVRVHVMRYEDMLARPLETFSGAVSFAGLSADREKIEKALRFSAFEVLQAQEKEKGFMEKAPVDDLFFRDGRAGRWRDRLTTAQADRIIRDHGEVMRRFGYL